MTLERSTETEPLLQTRKTTDVSALPSPAAKESPSLQVVIGAYILATISMLGSCISIASVQILAGSIPEFELNTWRFACQIFTSSPFVICKGTGLKVPRKLWHLWFVILLLYIVYNATYYTSAIYLPVGIVGGLNNTIVMVINSFLSLYFVKERRLYLYLSAAVSSGAILLLTQPGGMFRDEDSSQAGNWTSPCVVAINDEFESSFYNSTQSPIESPGSQQWIGYVLLVISGTCSAISYRLVSIFVQEVSPYTLSLWVGLLGSIISALVMAATETPTLPNNPQCVGFLFAHAFGTALYSVFFPYCLKYIPPVIYVFIRSLQLVVLLIFQYTFLKDIMPVIGNWMEIFGGVLCFIGCIVSPLHQITTEVKNRLVRKTKRYP